MLYSAMKGKYYDQKSAELNEYIRRCHRLPSEITAIDEA